MPKGQASKSWQGQEESIKQGVTNKRAHYRQQSSARSPSGQLARQGAQDKRIDTLARETKLGSPAVAACDSVG